MVICLPNKIGRYSLGLFMAVFLFSSAYCQTDNKSLLRNNWQIQSSETANESGDVISTLKYSPDGWYPATVPSTIMSNLVSDSVYKNIFYGENLAKVDSNRFKVPWWYRTEFVINKKPGMNNVFLQFDGIIFRADIFLNGQKIAGSDSVFGVYRRFQFNVTKYIHPNGKNVLAVKITPPKWSELTVGFVDWNPRSPDDNMGIWREVSVKVSGDGSVNYPFVKSDIDLKTLKEAKLTISAEVSNNSEKELNTVLKGEIGQIKFSKKVSLQPNENKMVVFSPNDFPQLNIKDPHIWWTSDLGEPYLYNLKLQLDEGNKLSDEAQTTFGVRKVSDYINKEGHRGYKLNGKPILVRGGGWAANIFLQYNPEKLKSQVEYVRHMGLNAIRFEGFWGNNQDIYNLCDENGILIMNGFSCQWEWSDYVGLPADEYGAIKSPEDIKLAEEYWRDEIKALRNHPCVLVWLYGSDKFPRPVLEQAYLDTLKKYDPTRPSLSSAAEITSTITGRSAVKMNGPYDYEPPMYWLTDTKNGGAFGFNTETGPGPQIPPIETIKKMIPPKDLWPIDSVWNFHCGRHEFQTLDVYNKALYSHYGKPDNLEEYVTKAQLQNYDAMRAMFEAFTINRPTATGIIQWMMNSAWPEFYWQFYDYYLRPNGAFYGAKTANEPVHLAYNYMNHGIYAVNNTYHKFDDLTAKVKVLRFDLSEAYSYQKEIDVSPYESRNIVSLPAMKNLSTTYFLNLNLVDRNGKVVSRNFYCLSTKPDQLDTAGTKWFFTPMKSYADYTELNKLSNVKLDVSSKFVQKEGNYEAVVKLKNDTKNLAFQIYLSVKKGKDGEDVLPIFWDDNYFSLLPGESRTIKAHFSRVSMEGQEPQLKVSGWNITD